MRKERATKKRKRGELREKHQFRDKEHVLPNIEEDGPYEKQLRGIATRLGVLIIDFD